MELLERDEDLARLELLLKQAAAGEGHIVLLEGEAGIGKTSLLKAVDGLALQQGFTVLRARAAELEREFPHGVVRQLFEPLVRRATDELRAQVFRGAASLAAPVVGLGGEAPDRVDADFAVNHGLYWLTVELSDLAPLCLLVDDVHWSDPASLAFLDYLSRRVQELPVLLLTTVRSGDPGSDQPLLQALRELPGIERLRPGLLSKRSTGSLICSRTSRLPEAELVDACHEATRGNPFFVEEMLRALPEDGLDPASVRALGPTSLAQAVLGRLARMLPEALTMAEAVAVLDVDAAPRHVAALAGLELPVASVAADALVAASVLTTDRTLRFLHPILRRAVYEAIPPLRRGELHRRAADVLREHDADRAAVHLLLTHAGGDTDVVEELRRAAERAAGRGAPAAASRLLRRALEEPPCADQLPAIAFELGHAAHLAGEPDSVALLERAAATATEDAARAEAVETFGAALIITGDYVRGFEVLSTGVDTIAEREPRLRLVGALNMLSVFSEDDAYAARARIDQLLPNLTGATPSERVLLAGAGYHRLLEMSAPAGEILALAQRADPVAMIREQPAGSLYWAGALDCFQWLDRHDLAEPVLDEAFAHARRTGSEAALSMAWVMRSRWADLRGDVKESEECARLAATTGPALGPLPLLYTASMVVLSLLQQGRTGDAEAYLDELGLRDTPIPPLATGRCLLLVRAHLNAAVHRQDDALADAREAQRLSALRGGSLVTTGYMFSNAAALLAAGDVQEASEVARRELELARCVGAASSIANALVAVGLCSSGQSALDSFVEAAALLEGTPRRLDEARALLEYGAALRRSNRRAEAREPLTRAADLAHHCRATALVERARQELLATGARPRRLVVTGADALTASERRVAGMAAEGMTNTEIAQALFVTRKTVEKHLAGAFQKLGISSRTQLRDALGEGSAKR